LIAFLKVNNVTSLAQQMRARRDAAYQSMSESNFAGLALWAAVAAGLGASFNSVEQSESEKHRRVFV